MARDVDPDEANEGGMKEGGMNEGGMKEGSDSIRVN
jgi:hypothetical protein